MSAIQASNPHTQAVIDELVHQRESYADRCATMAGQLGAALARVAELEAKLSATPETPQP
jgi:hypothetical protein